jgi:hypothetical protein
MAVPAGDLEGVVLAQLHDHLGTEPGSTMLRGEIRDHVEKVVVEKDRILVTYPATREANGWKFPQHGCAGAINGSCFLQPVNATEGDPTRHS